MDLDCSCCCCCSFTGLLITGAFAATLLAGVFVRRKAFVLRRQS